MNSIKFLGTAGARFVVMKQLRASGGLVVTVGDTRMLVDPGPGSLVRALKSRPRVDPAAIDAIFLSHKHLDHAGDVNVMIEAMTNGGFQRRGVLLAPRDALEGEAVVFRYAQGFPERVEILRERDEYTVKDITLTVPPAHLHHGVETYGFKLRSPGVSTIAYIPDAKYSDELASAYRNSEIVIICTVLYERRPDLEHLSLPEAEDLIRAIHPRQAILTHFGMTMLKQRIWEKTDDISQRLGVEVIAASDGLLLSL